MFATLDLKDLNLDGRVEIGKQTNWGGYSDISQGTLLIGSGKSKVAIKALRIRQCNEATPSDERLQKRFFREVLLWRTLSHPNIVPLLGYTMLPDGLPTLISPWYTNGNIRRYLETHPRSNRMALALDVTNGLEYLHMIPIAHGDLKGENILVNADGRASLCDFGMSQFIDDACRITGYTTSNANTGGTDRFMCPELLDDGPNTSATDIWAFGCLVVQILTDQIPYQSINRKRGLPLAIIRGDPPMTNNCGLIDNSLWNCLKRCWSMAPNSRPKVSEIRQALSVAPPLRPTSPSKHHRRPSTPEPLDDRRPRATSR